MLRKTRARLGLVALTVASGGHTALNALLASCASCIVTANIDNGHGAACAALPALSPRAA